MSVDFIGEYYITYLAVSVRLLAFLTFVPVIGAQRVPVSLRVALALVLALVLLPGLAAISPTALVWPLDLIALMIRELTVGVTLGFMVQLVFMVPRLFGRIADIEFGFGIAQTIDPQYGTAPLTGQFLYYAVVLGWLATSGHHELLRAIVATFRVVPVAQAVPDPRLGFHVAVSFARLFASAVRIGLPFLIPLFLATVTMGMLARAMPQLNLLIVGIPMKLLVGFVILALTLPGLMRGFAALLETIPDELVQTIQLLN